MAIHFLLLGLFIYVAAFLIATGVFFLTTWFMSTEATPPKWYDEFVIILGISLGIISFMFTIRVLTGLSFT